VGNADDDGEFFIFFKSDPMDTSIVRYNKVKNTKRKTLNKRSQNYMNSTEECEGNFIIVVPMTRRQDVMR
jgi:hypothetical protein